MNPLLRKFTRFVKKEWFLFVTLVAIGLIVLLFEIL